MGFARVSQLPARAHGAKVNPLEAYLAFARELADTARAMTRCALAAGLKAELKPDRSYVTALDRDIERALREAIAQTYPAHGVLGEEFGATRAQAEYQWLLDPVDGTDNLAHGTPTFGTIIGLHRAGVPQVAIIDHPALDLRYSAARGQGTYCNDKRVHIDDFAHVTGGEDIVITTAPENFAKTGDLPVLTRLQEAFPNTRVYRDCFAHTRVAQGSAAAMVEFNVQAWDMAAAPLLVQEAGGVYREIAWPRRAGLGYYHAVFGRADAVAALCRIIEAPV